MTDIVERLRREHALLCPDGSPYLAGEAADEIERLREALASARAEALEEAAKVAEKIGGQGFSMLEYPAKLSAEHQATLIIAAIRKLKEAQS